MTLTIAVESSTWNNIGDSFYQESIINALGQALDANVVPWDGPPQRAFRPKPLVLKNVADIRNRVDADHVVLSGPILSLNFLDLYAPIIRDLAARGVSYSLLSVHAYAENEEIGKLRRFFEEFPPVAFHTRDNTTFEKFKGIADVELDGICFAFFVSKLPSIPAFSKSKNYICSSFHSQYEPRLAFGSLDELLSMEVVSSPKEKPSVWRIKRQLEHRMQDYPESIGGLDVIRPVHGFYPQTHVVFSRANSFISYNPRVFLGVYKSCSATVTDRVHAGVASLSFGNPAQVVRLDGRYALFEKAPVKLKDGWLHLDEEKLEDIWSDVQGWLKDKFQAALIARHSD